jgi:hypothetical protein
MRHPSQSSGLRFPSDLDLCLPCPPVNLSTCQLVLPSGQLANRSTDQPIAPSSVIDSVIHSVIHSFRVAGGNPRWRVAGLFHSALHSVLNAALHSVLRDRFSHLSSTQSSISGGRWQPQVAGGGLFHSALHSVLNAALHSVLCDRFSHLSSTQSSISGGRWQPQVAGGGLFHSALYSVLNAVLHSALRDRFSHLSSVIDSVIHSVIHSALPEAARSARGAAPTSRQCPEITKNDEPRTKNSPDQHPLCRDAVLPLPNQLKDLLGQQCHA